MARTYLQDMALRHKKNLPAPVLAESPNETFTCAKGRDEARESTTEKPLTGLQGLDSRGGQKFDRKKYMREYMKKHRKKPKKCPHCGREL